MERAAENVHLRLTARVMMAVGVPIFIAVATGAASWVISTLSEHSKALTLQGNVIIQMGEVLKGVQTYQIPSNTTLLNSRIDAHAERISAIDRKNEQQDHELQLLRELLTSIVPKSLPTPPLAPRKSETVP